MKMKRGMIMATNDGSYRVHFNFNDPLQVRLYDCLAQLSRKDRHSLMLYALTVVLRRSDYTIPEDGIVGIFANMVGGNSVSPNLPSFEDLKAKYQKPDKPKKTERKTGTEKPKINAGLELTDEDDDENDEVSSFILGTLKDI